MRRDIPPAQFYHRILESYLIPSLKGLKMTPTGLSLTGLVISGLAGLSYLVSPVLAGILALVGGICDSLDGILARATGQVSQRGAFLDSVLDRYGESCLLIGAWAYLNQYPAYSVLGPLVVFAALIGSIMVSYTRARGESLAVSFDGGLFTRPERLILMAAGSLIDPLAPGLVLFLTVTALALGANITAIYRFWRISEQLARADHPATSPATTPE